MDKVLRHVKIVTGQVEQSIIREKDDYIIAVDSGIGIVRNFGIIPDCLVGDLDSAAKEDIQWAKDNDINIIKYPVEKDFVDTQLALDIAYQVNPTEITIYNELSGRFDHAITLAYLLLQPLKRGIKARIVSKNNIIYLVDKHITIASSDSYVSIFPFTPQAQATAVGLKYNLPEIFYAENPMGISNEFIKERAEITVKQGIILLIMSKIV